MSRILVVEDESDLAELYRLHLVERGHQVLGPFADPRDSLPPSAAGPVDLILLDERLGLQSGTAYLGRYRRAYPGAKIFLVSADPDAVANAPSKGADGALKKPVPLGRILKEVGLLLAPGAGAG